MGVEFVESEHSHVNLAEEILETYASRGPGLSSTSPDFKRSSLERGGICPQIKSVFDFKDSP